MRFTQGDAGYYGPHFVCNMSFWTLIDAVNQSAGSVVSDVGIAAPSSGAMRKTHLFCAVFSRQARDKLGKS